MECPVCNTSGLPEDAESCKNCGSDLEALQLTKMIKKSGKGRLVFSYIASALFLIVLFIWILNCIFHWYSNEESESKSVDTELNTLNQQLEQEKKLNAQLQLKIKDLNADLDNKVQIKTKNEKQWVVKEGESLFYIASKVYGNGFKYGIIAEDNNIEDPNIIMVGQKLIIYY